MSIAPGQKGPLLHSVKARQRILVGLSWDPNDAESGFFDKLRGHEATPFDLDLSCLMFDASGDFLAFIGADAQDSIGPYGAVYHSGDDDSGAGGGDDETISAELASLPKEVQHIVFIVEVRSEHTFGQVYNPAVRLADGLSNKDLLATPIAANGAQAMVFARVYRDGASDTGWSLHHIADYPDISKIGDWGEYLQKHLK